MECAASHPNLIDCLCRVKSNSSLEDSPSALEDAESTLDIFSHRLEPFRPADLGAENSVRERRNCGGPVVIAIIDDQPLALELDSDYFTIVIRFKQLQFKVSYITMNEI